MRIKREHMMSETKEQEMLARAKTGDQEAFAWRYEN